MRALFVTVVTLGLGVLGLGGCIYKSDIDHDEAHRLVEQRGALLVDVRAPDEYAERHPAEAVNIPLPELAAHVNDLPHDRPIIVYCHTGVRASLALRKLRAAGFTNVRNLGTLSHWYVDPTDTVGFE